MFCLLKQKMYVLTIYVNGFYITRIDCFVNMLCGSKLILYKQFNLLSE